MYEFFKTFSRESVSTTICQTQIWEDTTFSCVCKPSCNRTNYFKWNKRTEQYRSLSAIHQCPLFFLQILSVILVFHLPPHRHFFLTTRDWSAHTCSRVHRVFPSSRFCAPHLAYLQCRISIVFASFSPHSPLFHSRKPVCRAPLSLSLSLSLALFLPFSTYVNIALFLCYLIRSCTISHQHFFLLYLPQRHVVVREYRDTEESADAQTQHSRCHQSAGSAVAAIISHQPRQAKAATHSLSLSTLCPLRKARPLVVAQK